MTVLCLACYEDRLASVLENATEFLLFERDGGHIRPAGHVSLPSKDPTDRTSAIVACGVTQLVCGAICRGTEARLQRSGVAVDAWLRGPVDRVLQALERDDLESLAMPGCAGRNRCGQGQDQGQDQGQAQGRGQGGPGRKRGMGNRRTRSGRPGE